MQEWTYAQRLQLEKTCQSAYFLAIVQVQWADVIISKTRVLSIFQQVSSSLLLVLPSPLCQGMSNWVLNLGLVFETCCAAFLLYFPWSYVLGFYPLAPEWWLPALPYTLLIFVGDEVSSCPSSCPTLALRSAATT